MRFGPESMVLAAALLAGCGGGSTSDGGGTGSCEPGQTALVTIAATGFTPRAVCVLPGGAVTFANGDTVAHDVESGMTCQALNLGPIAAGQSRTATFPTAATCPFFDAAHSSDPAFQGTVAVSSAPTTGPGY
jgi:plastocyanin